MRRNEEQGVSDQLAIYKIDGSTASVLFLNPWRALRQGFFMDEIEEFLFYFDIYNKKVNN